MSTYEHETSHVILEKNKYEQGGILILFIYYDNWILYIFKLYNDLCLF